MKSFVEASEIDGGEFIGRDPRNVPSDILARSYPAKNPIKAIRAKCIDCCCGQPSEVRKCTATDCALWPFRMGKNPFRTKRTLTPEQLAALHRGRAA